MIYLDKRKGLDICILSDDKLHILSDDKSKASIVYEDLKDAWNAIDTNEIKWEYTKDSKGNYILNE